jgi:hypothetical protein
MAIVRDRESTRGVTHVRRGNAAVQSDGPPQGQPAICCAGKQHLRARPRLEAGDSSADPGMKGPPTRRCSRRSRSTMRYEPRGPGRRGPLPRGMSRERIAAVFDSGESPRRSRSMQPDFPLRYGPRSPCGASPCRRASPKTSTKTPSPKPSPSSPDTLRPALELTLYPLPFTPYSLLLTPYPSLYPLPFPALPVE